MIARTFYASSDTNKKDVLQQVGFRIFCDYYI